MDLTRLMRSLNIAEHTGLSPVALRVEFESSDRGQLAAVRGDLREFGDAVLDKKPARKGVRQSASPRS